MTAKRPAWAEALRKRVIHWLKERGRPGLNAFLVRYSLVGDPEVFDTALFPWSLELERSWEVIASEAESALRLREHIPAFQEISPDQYRISNTDEWKTLWYRGFGHRSEVFARLKPISERSRQHAGPRGRAEQRERFQRHIQRTGIDTVTQHGIIKTLLRPHIPHTTCITIDPYPNIDRNKVRGFRR